MARGNQRDKAREANLKKQKSKNNLSGSEMAKAKESAAEIMRQKQAAGQYPRPRGTQGCRGKEIDFITSPEPSQSVIRRYETTSDYSPFYDDKTMVGAKKQTGFWGWERRSNGATRQTTARHKRAKLGVIIGLQIPWIKTKTLQLAFVSHLLRQMRP
ncbi:4F5 protein family protein [Sarocladium implicatum]|nr:4F5 protein family protein [Sarocladium implicatum]